VTKRPKECFCLHVNRWSPWWNFTLKSAVKERGINKEHVSWYDNLHVSMVYVRPSVLNVPWWTLFSRVPRSELNCNLFVSDFELWRSYIDCGRYSGLLFPCRAMVTKINVPQFSAKRSICFVTSYSLFMCFL
jgi:hypothetical protein